MKEKDNGSDNIPENKENSDNSPEKNMESMSQKSYSILQDALFPNYKNLYFGKNNNNKEKVIVKVLKKDKIKSQTNLNNENLDHILHKLNNDFPIIKDIYLKKENDDIYIIMEKYDTDLYTLYRDKNKKFNLSDIEIIACELNDIFKKYKK